MATSQHTPPTPEIQGANPASTLADATCEVLSIGDALLFLADSEHPNMPSGLAHMLRALAERCHAVGGALDGIKLEGGSDE